MQRRPNAFAATALAATLALVACGGDDDPAPGATGSGDVDEPASDQAPLTGDPVRIGFINSEGGAFSVPELRVGSEVAEDLVNTQLGGIGGRPLEVIRCATDGSPEASIDCANQLVEAGVVVVQEGTDLGADAVLPILADAGIPLVGHVQFGPGRMFDSNSYYFGAAALAYGAAALQFYDEQGAESIVWFFPDEPTSHAFTDGVLVPTAEALGIDYQTVYYDPLSPNFAVLAATAVSESPDVSGALAATDGQCAELIAALRGAGFDGDILAASCVGLYEALGDDAVGVHTDADHWHPLDTDAAPQAKQEDLALYAEAMTEAGHEDLVAGNAIITFADTINLARILSTITGTVDAAAVSAALQATVGFESFAGPTISCDDSVLPGNSACSTGLLFFEVQDDGAVETLTPDFVDVSALLTPAG
ncbi:MAG TPA: ABC transporter substrate-binding protein [Acidimicrobiales bacterium]|nr:ABC transporter substrate-binding protein [Acidimicrobiales bacterium]